MNRAFFTRAMFGLALFMPLGTEAEEWESISCWPKPHGWYELITKLETTRVDLFSVTNLSLRDALRLASDKYMSVRGLPLSSVIRARPDYVIPEVTLTLRETSVVALYDALANAAGLRWRLDAAIVFYHPDDDSKLTLWRGVPTPAGRYLFDRLPPRICAHGPSVQLAYLPPRNMLIYQDQEHRGDAVMQGFYSVGLITNVEILVKGLQPQGLTPQ